MPGDAKADKSRWSFSIEILRKGLIDIAIVLVAVAVALVLGQAVFSNPTVIEQVSVPDELAKRGYTGTVAAYRILDEITAIKNVSETTKNVFNVSALKPELTLPKVELPGASISLEGAVATLRSLLGKSDTKIIGEIVAAEPGGGTPQSRYHVQVRISGKGAVFRSMEPTDNLEALTKEAAIQIAGALDPYIAALYLKEQADKNGTSDYSRALKMLESVRPGSEDFKWMLNLRGLIEHQKKNYDNAISDFEWINKRFPDFPISRYNLAQSLNAKGYSKAGTEEGASLHRKALQVAPEGVRLDSNGRRRSLGYVNAGNAAKSLGDERRALKYFQTAARADPKDFYAHYNQGDILISQKKFDGAIEVYRHAYDIDPRAARSLYGWARALQAKDGDSEGAVEGLLRRALAVDPEHASTLNWLGVFHLDRDEYAPARELFARAVEASPRYYYAHCNLGRSLLGLKKSDDAISALKRAIEISGAKEWCREELQEAMAVASTDLNKPSRRDQPADGDLIMHEITKKE